MKSDLHLGNSHLVGIQPFKTSMFLLISRFGENFGQYEQEPQHDYKNIRYRVYLFSSLSLE